MILNCRPRRRRGQFTADDAADDDQALIRLLGKDSPKKDSDVGSRHRQAFNAKDVGPAAGSDEDLSPWIVASVPSFKASKV